MWFDLENADGVYRITDFAAPLNLHINEKPIRRFIAIADGDVITVGETDISFSFFSLETRSSLITTNRDQPHISRFIEDAALEAASSAKRDDAKAFLREFVRELSREITWTSKFDHVCHRRCFYHRHPLHRLRGKQGTSREPHSV